MGGIFINRKDEKVEAKRKVRYKPVLLHEDKKCSSYSESSDTQLNTFARSTHFISTN